MENKQMVDQISRRMLVTLIIHRLRRICYQISIVVS